RNFFMCRSECLGSLSYCKETHESTKQEVSRFNFLPGFVRDCVAHAFTVTYSAAGFSMAVERALDDSRTVGTIKRNVVPLPSLLFSTHMRPECDWTIWRAS